MDLVNILPALESIASSINFGPLNDLLAKIRQFVDRIVLFITPDAPVRDAGLAMAGYADSAATLITRLGNSLPELQAGYSGPAADHYYASAEQALQMLQKLHDHLNGSVDRHAQLAEHFAEALLQQGMLIAQGAIMAVDLGSLIFTGGLDAPVSVPVAAGDAVVADGSVVAMDAAVDAADTAVGAIGESAGEIGDMAFDLGDDGAGTLADGDPLAGDASPMSDPSGEPPPGDTPFDSAGDGPAQGGSAFPDSEQLDYNPSGTVYGQSSSGSCVAASGRMALSDFGQDLPEAYVREAAGVDPVDGGFIKNLPQAFQDLGGPDATWVENSTTSDLQAATAGGNPAIVTVRQPGLLHALVVDGFEETDIGTTVQLRDPLPMGDGSAYSVLLSTFEDAWTGQMVFFP